jgi:hypothetical protein
MKSVAIIEGWAGGKGLSRGFRQALAGQGFSAGERSEADIIICHSIGCYDLPRHYQAQLVLLIDPPYWPGRSIIRNLLSFADRTHKPARASQLGKSGYWKKLAWEIFYIFAKPGYSLMGLRHNDIDTLLGSLEGRQVIVIRNQLDDFCSPKIREVVARYNNVDLRNLPGVHDDYYTNPAPYIALLRQQTA